MSPGRASVSAADMATLRRAMPRAFGASPVVRFGLAGGWLAFAGLIALCLWRWTPRRSASGRVWASWVAATLDAAPNAWRLAAGV